MKRILRTAVAAALTSVCWSVSPDDAAFFPVMAWNSPPIDPPALTKMQECGFTVAGFVPPSGLDAVAAAGLKAIVSDPRVGGYDWLNVDEMVARSRVASLVAEVGRHPAVYGYYLRDEPPAALFPGLAKVASLLREFAPDKWAYINLFPNYANPDQLAAASYAEYIEQFVTSCRPTTLSYDHYALLDDGSLREGYWRNLEQIRAAGKKHRLSFWNIVLTAAHFDYREATAADLRLQVFSTLAYGGRGIAYFTYFAPKIGNYRAAPVDQFGHMTPLWNHLQNVNLQIAKLAPTLLELQSDDVYHFAAVPDGSQRPPPSSLVSAVPGEFAAGDFTHRDGSRYVMLVNKSVTKSIACAPQFRNPPKAVQAVSPYTGLLTVFEGEQVWVAPGHGTLLKLTF